MEVSLSDPQLLPAPSRRGTPLPLSQLLEDSRRCNVPNHLLESKVYTKLKSNRLIQAEPLELHFSGFELEKGYIKMLKIINISTEVLSVHIIPTQTKHFETTYDKKYRLIPGLAYTLKVRFCPDEWRYFYDSVRVHCKGEENLLIPVHAYPVINDLHIPTHMDLSAVPLGQSVCRAIPLRCRCPVDFEFQVFVIQPHEAFSINPLTGLIPANGEVEIIVTFSPIKYETAQVTIQVIISQFNTKPYLCTIKGSSVPHIHSRGLGRRAADGDAVPERDETSSPAAQLKTRIPPFKTKDRSTKAGERAPPSNFHNSFQQELGQRALAPSQQTAQRVMIRCQMNHRPTCLKKLSDRQKSLPLAETSFDSPVTSSFRSEEDRTWDLEISPDRVCPSSLQIFCDEGDPLALSGLDTLHVGTIDVTGTTCIPFFSLQDPQHYKLMGYQPPSAWKAFNSYIPATFARPLRNGALNESVPNDFGAKSLTEEELKAGDEQQLENEEEDVVAWDDSDLNFSAPDNLFRHSLENPLRIFNPAPGLQNYKTSKYLESDLDFHLCPVPRYKIPERKMCDIRKQTFLDREESVQVLKTWNNFSPDTLNCLSNRSELNFDCVLRRSVGCSTTLLQEAPPPPMGSPGGSCPLMHEVWKGSRVQLTPEMVRAEFLSGKALVLGSNFTREMTPRHQGELQREPIMWRSNGNRMGRRVTTRLKQLVVTRNSPLFREGRGKQPLHTPRNTKHNRPPSETKNYQ